MSEVCDGSSSPDSRAHRVRRNDSAPWWQGRLVIEGSNRSKGNTRSTDSKSKADSKKQTKGGEAKMALILLLIAAATIIPPPGGKAGW
jgi:hypothetical protein